MELWNLGTLDSKNCPTTTNEGGLVMRTLSAAAAALAVLLTAGGLAQAPPSEKGGGDETGPYDLVAGWPQNYCGEGFQIGSTAGIWAESPDRVLIFARGCLPVLKRRGRRRWRRRRRARPAAQCLRVRPLAERSDPPSSLGSRRHLCRPQWQDDRVVGAAQQVVRATAPRSGQPLRSRASHLAGGRRRACDLQVHARWQEAGADHRYAHAVGQRPDPFRATDRHRLAARWHVLRQRWLRQHSCRQVQQGWKVPAHVGRSGKAAERDETQLHEHGPRHRDRQEQTHLHQRSRELADPGVRREWEVPGCLAEGQAPLFTHADRRSASLGG